MRNCLLFVLALINVSVFGFDQKIHWQEWSRAPFEQAKKENKLILVNVGMEGCWACYRMEVHTYTDPQVIQLINTHFVPIYADSEARPDLGERYSNWAWPATAFLQPDATQVHAIAGNRLPRNFIPILEDLIAKHEAGTLSADSSSFGPRPAAVETDLTKARNQVRGQIDRYLNDQGGWSRSPMGPGAADGSRLRHLYLRAHMYDNDELMKTAVASARGFERLLDPVWGGAYGRKFPDGVSVPAAFAKLRAIPEKRSYGQANALFAYAMGYRQTEAPLFRQASERMHGFLTEWFSSASGTFFTNQKVEPPKPLPKGMTPQEYWTLDHDGRMKYGVPPIDQAVYTDRNGQIITAYVEAFEAFGDQRYFDAAAKAARALLKARQTDTGWMLQTSDDKDVRDDQRMRPYDLRQTPQLNAQAWFGTALLALHRASGDAQWLMHAVALGDATLAELADPAGGGFFASPPDDTADFIPPRKPLEYNGTAANFFYDLAVYTKIEKFSGVAERTLRAVATPDAIRAEGRVTAELGIALEKVTAAYVEFSVVGERSDPRTRALFDAARGVENPRKILHFEAPGRYPDRGVPSLYVCNPDRCSVPIEDPKEVPGAADQFRAPARTVT